LVLAKDAKPGDNGRLERCPQCADLLPKSRLNQEDRALSVAHIADRADDPSGEAAALRFMAKKMLNEPIGFSSLYGSNGSAKTLYLAVLVAEFCRAGRQAMYFNADEITAMLTPGDDKEIDGMSHIHGDPGAYLNYLKRIPVLAIDELDKIPWSTWQIQKIGALIEHRHINAARCVTLLAMNRSPWHWHNAGAVRHIAERLADGRYNRYWPDQFLSSLPGCLADFKDNLNGKTAHYAPGLFEVKAPSMRSQLRRFEEHPLSRSDMAEVLGKGRHSNAEGRRK
jgi:hypothetical protein